MSAKKLYMVTDLGPGDGGKGGVVHKLSTLRRAHTIIKVGGGQGSHGVRTSGGESFAFSQWGCGTLEGTRTHISPRFVAIPVGLLNEASALRYNCGVHDPFELLTIDEGALCATPYHGISSRLKELARGDDPRGTIGTGAGEARRYHLSHPDLSLFARDLARPELRARLAAVRDRLREDLAPLIAGPFIGEDRALADEEIAHLKDDDFLDHVVDRFETLSRRLRVVPGDYMAEHILSREGAVVVESSHGVLTDALYGFHPHTSAIRTLPALTRGMIEAAGYDGQIVSIAVHRAYTIRHGAGPMPTADPNLAEALLPGSHKDENRYQGKVRVGPLDLPLMRYAIEASGPGAYDALAMTWFDQISQRGAWRLCPRYSAGAEDELFFDPSGALRVHHGDGEAQLAHQRALGQRLTQCVPDIEVHRIPSNAAPEELARLCAATLKERLEVPVRMVSLGPTEHHKITL